MTVGTKERGEKWFSLMHELTTKGHPCIKSPTLFTFLTLSLKLTIIGVGKNNGSADFFIYPSNGEIMN